MAIPWGAPSVAPTPAISSSLNRIGEDTLYGRLPAMRTIAPCPSPLAPDNEARLASRMSPVTSETLPGSRGRSSSARSRSISTAVMWATLGASLSVRAPAPGPISRKTSSAAGAMAATTLSAHTDSRKCWPKRLRMRGTYRCFPGLLGFLGFPGFPAEAFFLTAP